MTTFSAFIHAERERYSLSLSEAAKLIKSTKAHVWELEQGKSCNPTILTLANLAAAYRLDVGKLARLAAAAALDAEAKKRGRK